MSVLGENNGRNSLVLLPALDSILFTHTTHWEKQRERHKFERKHYYGRTEYNTEEQLLLGYVCKLECMSKFPGAKLFRS